MPSLTTSDILLIIGGFGAMLVSVIGSIAAAFMAYQAKDHAKSAADKTETVVSLARTIEAQGNSKASADKTQIASLEQQLATMVGMLTKSEERALELARVQAARAREFPPPASDLTAVAHVITEALHATPPTTPTP
jgi:hypothetical protein